MHLLRRFLVLCVLPVALLASACGGGSDSPTAPSTPAPAGPAELQKTDLVVGTGDAEVVTNKLVSLVYVLWRYDPAGPDFKGQALQQNSYQFRTGTNAAIPGFEQGIMGMKVGGVRRIIVPPGLAYGSQGQKSNDPAYDIRPNEWLVFEMQIVAIS